MKSRGGPSSEFSVSLADPRFMRAVTAYQALRRAFHALALDEEVRLQDALAIIEETLVLGALRASVPHLAERGLYIEAEERLPETIGQGSHTEQTAPVISVRAMEVAEAPVAHDIAGEAEPTTP
jgi:hypothetical protein